MNWLLANLTIIGVVVSIITSLGALALSILNRIDQRRDAQERRRERDPHFTVMVNPVATDDGWRPMKLVFWSPHGIGFTIHTVEALTPKSMLLAARGKDAARDVERVGRKLPVEWRVDAPRDRATPASQTNIFCNIAGMRRRRRCESSRARLRVLGANSRWSATRK